MREQDFRELAGIVYYELRSPLTSIVGYAELMLGETAGPINDNQRDMIQTMSRNSRHCLNVLHYLYEVILLRAGEKKPVFEAIDINVILDAVLERYADYLNGTGAILRINRADTDLVVRADRYYLELLLGQLVQDMPNGPSKPTEIRLYIQEGSVFIDIQAGFRQETSKTMWPQPLVAFMARSILEVHGGAMAGGYDRHFQMRMPESSK